MIKLYYASLCLMPFSKSISMLKSMAKYKKYGIKICVYRNLLLILRRDVESVKELSVS